MVGRMLGRYRVEEKVGEGGMGVVYRAEDTRLNRTVALKMIHPDLVKDRDARERFVREAQSASALVHPNICTIHSIEEDEDGGLFLVLEFLRGQTLKQCAELTRDTRALLDCAVQMAEGLAEAHRISIVHRDIKSTNVLRTDRGLIKIMDFGLAKQVGPRAAAATATGPNNDVTQTGASVGTPAYMSPEQALGRDLDARSDVFSLGVVLYEISTGRLPFPGGNAVEAIDNLLHKEPPPPRYLNPDLPPEFERIVLKALRKDRDERYTSAAEIVVDLKMLRREVDTGVRSGVQPAATPAGARGWQSLALVLAAIALLVGITLGAVLLVSRKNETPAVVATSGRSLLAVLNFENQTGEPAYDRYGLGATELLTVNLAQAGGAVDLVSSHRLFDVLRGMNKEMAKLDRSVATEVARSAGARYMLHGEVLKVSDSVILKAQIVEVEGGRLVSAHRVLGVNDRNLLDKIDELSNLMREDLKGLR